MEPPFQSFQIQDRAAAARHIEMCVSMSLRVKWPNAAVPVPALILCYGSAFSDKADIPLLIPRVSLWSDGPIKKL